MAVLNTTILPEGSMQNITADSSDSGLEYEELIMLQGCFLAVACSFVLVLIEYERNHWNGKIDKMLSRIQSSYTLDIMMAAIFVVLPRHSALENMVGEVVWEIFVYLIHLGTMAAYMLMNAGWLEIMFAIREPTTMKFNVNYYAASATLIPVLAIVFGELVPQWYMPSSEDASTTAFTTPSAYILWSRVVSRCEMLKMGLAAVVLGNCGMTMARAVPHLRCSLARGGVYIFAVSLGGVALINSGLLVQMAPLDHPPTHAALVFLYVSGVIVSVARLCFEVQNYRMKKRDNAEYVPFKSVITVRHFREINFQQDYRNSI